MTETTPVLAVRGEADSRYTPKQRRSSPWMQKLQLWVYQKAPVLAPKAFRDEYQTVIHPIRQDYKKGGIAPFTATQQLLYNMADWLKSGRDLTNQGWLVFGESIQETILEDWNERLQRALLKEAARVAPPLLSGASGQPTAAADLSKSELARFQHLTLPPDQSAAPVEGWLQGMNTLLNDHKTECLHSFVVSVYEDISREILYWNRSIRAEQDELVRERIFHLMLQSLFSPIYRLVIEHHLLSSLRRWVKFGGQDRQKAQKGDMTAAVQISSLSIQELRLLIRLLRHLPEEGAQHQRHLTDKLFQGRLPETISDVTSATSGRFTTPPVDKLSEESRLFLVETITKIQRSQQKTLKAILHWQEKIIEDYPAFIPLAQNWVLETLKVYPSSPLIQFLIPCAVKWQAPNAAWCLALLKLFDLPQFQPLLLTLANTLNQALKEHHQPVFIRKAFQEALTKHGLVMRKEGTREQIIRPMPGSLESMIRRLNHLPMLPSHLKIELVQRFSNRKTAMATQGPVWFTVWQGITPETFTLWMGQLARTLNPSQDSEEMFLSAQDWLNPNVVRSAAVEYHHAVLLADLNKLLENVDHRQRFRQALGRWCDQLALHAERAERMNRPFLCGLLGFDGQQWLDKLHQQHPHNQELTPATATAITESQVGDLQETENIRRENLKLFARTLYNLVKKQRVMHPVQPREILVPRCILVGNIQNAGTLQDVLMAEHCLWLDEEWLGDEVRLMRELLLLPKTSSKSTMTLLQQELHDMKLLHTSEATHTIFDGTTEQLATDHVPVLQHTNESHDVDASLNSSLYGSHQPDRCTQWPLSQLLGYVQYTLNVMGQLAAANSRVTLQWDDDFTYNLCKFYYLKHFTFQDIHLHLRRQLFDPMIREGLTRWENHQVSVCAMVFNERYFWRSSLKHPDQILSLVTPPANPYGEAFPSDPSQESKKGVQPDILYIVWQ